MSTRSSHPIIAIARLSAILMLALACVITVRSPLVAYAASLTVTTTADELNVDGDCSLREAIRAANLDAPVDACAGRHGSDTINIPVGTYTLALPGTDEEDGLTGDLDITADLTLKGAGTTKTNIDGNTLDRVFEVRAGKVTFSDMTIQNGVTLLNGPTELERGGGGILNRGGTVKVSKVTVTNNDAGYGSGIFNAGALTVDHSTIISNRSANWNAGGIYNTGNLTLTKSSVANNSADESGGGLFNNGGTMQIVESTLTGNAGAEGAGAIDAEGAGGTISILNSTLSDNHNGNDHGGAITCNASTTITIANSTLSGNQATGADASAGAIWCAGNLTIMNSTISGNKTWGSGGGLQSVGTTTLNNVTIAYNVANMDNDTTGDGGGVRIDGGTLRISNSIIGVNSLGSGQASDCSGVLTSQGYNLIQTIAGCTITGSTSGNKTGVDPLLAPLGDNGGPTFMHALRSNSPALDKGSSAKPGSGIPACEAKDQRGVNRPQGKRCDMGAYERRP